MSDEPLPYMWAFGPYALNTMTNVVSKTGGAIVQLTRAEATVLKCLITVPGQVVLRGELEMALRPNPGTRTMSTQSNCLEVFVRRLRAKLDPDGTQRLITTVRGRGYALREWPTVTAEQAAA